MNIIDCEKPYGVIVQFGGQTPLNLAERLEAAGAPIIGTSVASTARAEDASEFAAMISEARSQPAAKRHGLPIPRKRSRLPMSSPTRSSSGRRLSSVAGRCVIVYDDEELQSFYRYEAQAAADNRVRFLSINSFSRCNRGRCRRHSDGLLQIMVLRHHGAHRGSWNSFRRQCLRASPPHTLGRSSCGR